MSNYNPNWVRWVTISYAKHVDLLRENTPFYLEGFSPDPNDIYDAKSYFELRIDGPYTQEMAKRQWDLFFEINVLIVMHLDDKDSYGLERLIGIVNKFFKDEKVMVRKYGTGPEDDQELLGFLHVRPEQVKTSKFGRIRPDMRMLQASVEGHYDLYLD